MDQQINILIVDDHPLMREALCSALNTEPDIEVIDDVGTGEEALEVLKIISPDVILMDLGLPGMSGFDAIREIIAKNPQARILVNSSMEDEDKIISAVQAGALGYYPKTAPRAYLLEAIRKVADGVPYMPVGITKKLFDGVRKLQAPLPTSEEKNLLTARQAEVLRLMAIGKSDAEIAESLSLSMATVRSHIHHILQRLGLQSRTQAVAYAHKKEEGP